MLHQKDMSQQKNKQDEGGMPEHIQRWSNAVLMLAQRASIKTASVVRVIL